MPTEQPSPVSRRKLGLFGVLAGIAAVMVVVTGIRAREDSDSKLREWTDDQAVPTVAVTAPDAKITNPTIDLPGRLEAYQRAPTSQASRPAQNSRKQRWAGARHWSPRTSSPRRRSTSAPPTSPTRRGR